MIDRAFFFAGATRFVGPGKTFSLAVLLSLIAMSAAWGQADPKKKIPPPEDVELKDALGTPLTKDVLIKATFYPGTRGKDSVPIIMLHSWKGSRGDYAALAAYMQEKGHAVLVPDLRGHGESTLSFFSKRPVEADKLNNEHYIGMVKSDLEACKAWLMLKNNAGELNIEKLCLIGSEMGAIVAVNWAVMDWKWPVLLTGKQGQDAKCLVLLSPDWKVEKGALNMGEAVNDPLQTNLSTYIIYGAEKSGSSAVDAKRVHKSLERFHTSDPDSLQIFDVKTTLQGTKLLSAPELRVAENVAKIIEERLVNKTLTWRDRSGPLK